MKPDIISHLFNTIGRRPEIRGAVPMGFTPGIPVFSIRQENLCVEIPFLRYKTTGQKDRTLVFPVRYIATYLVPEMQLVAFVDLAFTPLADSTDFNKPIGFFRHAAIADLNRGQYAQLRADTLAGLDLLALSLLGERDDDPANEADLRANMSRIVEPSLYPIYRRISPAFFKKYIENGKDSQA